MGYIFTFLSPMPPNHRLPNDAQLSDPLCCPAISSLCGHTIRSVHLPCSNQASLPRNCSGASARFRTASDPNLQPFAFRSLPYVAQPSAPQCRPAISPPYAAQPSALLCRPSVRAVHFPCSTQASLSRNCSGASARFLTALDPIPP